ncbi:MAG: nitroreductase family protein [Methanoregula sp.]
MMIKTDQDNAVLDRIIGERRSCRKFTREIPADVQVESILHAGLHAPFAAAAIGDSKDYFRRFVVVRNGSTAMKELSPLVFEGVLATAGDLEQAAAKNAQLREQAAGAHCMENMWLKATALGLGFQIVSATAQMADNPGFCRALGLESGKWALMGCAVGYPAEKLSPSIRPSVMEVTTWL